MEIRYTQQKGEKPTQIRLILGSISKFVERDGVTELHVAMGDKKALPLRKVVLAMRKIVSTAKQNRLESIAIAWRDIRSFADRKISDKKLAEVAAIAFYMADFEFTKYKKTPAEIVPVFEDVEIIDAPREAQNGFARGESIAQEVNACRALSNTPGGDMTPRVLAEAAKEAIANTRATIDILGKREMQALGMGAVLGIAQGSAEEPQFIVLQYKGAPRERKPVVLLGKGVTFDTGGLQIKPGDHMYEMHMDMSGGAAVIHAVALAAKIKLNVNIVGLIPAVENAASGSAVRPGDILRSLSGRTIEILHTDAEGRVILADAITYAKQFDPKIVVDVATLTGAAVVALGTQASAFMTNRDALIEKFMQLGEESGDYVWPFPAWDEYEEMTKGTFGDIPNISTAGNSRDGGVIAGGMFLREFAKDLTCPWVHIDMAPRMTSNSNEFLAKGAVGAPVRLLLAIIEEYGR